MAEPPLDPPESAPPSRRRAERPLALVNDVLDGKYRLLRPLQRGSMGAVFAAENLSLAVPVAVKVVRADADPDARDELAERMLQEAHAAFQVDHPAILRVLDFGTTGPGDPYVVMEMLRGETLSGAMRQHGSVGPAEAVRVLMPVAHGLAAAHACSVVHRDVKPSNVFLARTNDGRIQPKLIDFGLAKAQRPARARITQVGAAMGSPAYMAPEQIRGEEVSGQADVWGFCVTLFEMVAGEIPFAAEKLDDLFNRILNESPTPLRNYGIRDPELAAIIEKGLQKEPHERWKSMAELGSALAEWLVDQGHTDDVCASSLTSMWEAPTRSAEKMDVLASVQPGRPRPRLPSLSELATGKWSAVGGRRWLLWAIVALLIGAIVGVAMQIFAVFGNPWRDDPPPAASARPTIAPSPAPPVPASGPVTTQPAAPPTTPREPPPP